MSELSNISNSEAERDLLGAILINNSLMDGLGYLQPDHFCEFVHQRIFQAIRNEVIGGNVANPITLKERFDKDEALADIGGFKYLVSLVGSAPSAPHVPSLSRTIYQTWQRRQIIEWSKEAIESATSVDCVPEEAAAHLSSKLSELGSTDKRRRVVSEDEIISEIIDELESGVEPSSTGLDKLDLCMGGGLFPAKMYGFGARQKVGKTLLGATLSYNLSENGVKHLFIAAEMGYKEIYQRVLARKMDVYPSAFRTDYKESQDFRNRIAMAATNTKKFALYQNAPGLSFNDLKQYMSTAVQRHKVKGVILDYWQLVGGKNSKDSEAKHLDNVSQWIADFVKEHEIFCVVFAQMNQEGNTRGSEGIRKSVDQFYEIHREDLSTGEAWLEMKDTRYTAWNNIGSDKEAGWFLEPKGLYFREIGGEIRDKTANYSAMRK